MEESILDTIKPLLNIELSDTSFDTELIVLINAALSDMQQLGIVDDNGYSIKSNLETWSEFTSDDVFLGMIQRAIYLKVRLDFDSPSNSFTVESLRKEIDKIEWRLTVVSDRYSKMENN